MLRKILLVGTLLIAGFVAGVLVIKLVDDNGSAEATIDDAVRGDGTLDSPASPLAVSDVEKTDGDSPDRAVLQMLYWAQWGNLPGIVESYAPEVVDGLGVQQMTGAFSFLRPQLAVSEPRIASVQGLGDDQAFVTFELYSATDAPQRESVVMRRADGDWLIEFDTLLERGLNSYTQQINAADPEDPSGQAIRKGDEAAQLYRNIAPSVALQATAEADSDN